MIRFRMLLIFVISLFVVGLVFGCISVLLMSLDQKVEITNQIIHFFEQKLYDDGSNSSLNLWDHSKRYLFLSGIIFILGLTVLGVPIVLLLIFVKGVILGFTTSFIINQLGGKGILFVLYSVIPQNLIILPALILFITSSVSISIFIIRNRILKYQGRLKPQLLSYFVVSLSMTALLVLASFYETFIAPDLMLRAVVMLPKSFLLFDLYSLSLL